MGRLARKRSKTGIYHVMLRGINRQNVFEDESSLNLFSLNREKAIESFIKFHKEFNNDKCLDYEDYIKLTDNEVKQQIINLGFKNVSELPGGQGDRILVPPYKFK